MGVAKAKCLHIIKLPLERGVVQFSRRRKREMRTEHDATRLTFKRRKWLDMEERLRT